MLLSELARVQAGVVEAVHGEGSVRRHLLDMGLTPNAVVTLQKAAPMGDPIELYLRGYVLTLRGEDAAKIALVSDSETPKFHHGHGHGPHERHHARRGCENAAQPEGEEQNV